jgi:integrative and conjugative element protein (TIGR02256 family)
VITYRVNETQRLAFSDAALATFARSRQTGGAGPESGGQLFGTVDEVTILVTLATEPSPRARRSRFVFAPNRVDERAEIRRLHRQGSTYLGDWHTHPEPFPSPSEIDLAAISDVARRSKHTAGPLLLVVVGTAGGTEGLFVGLHDGRETRVLRPGLAGV